MYTCLIHCLLTLYFPANSINYDLFILHLLIYFIPSLQVPVKSIIDDPYKEWSSEADFDWVDETNDMAISSRICRSRWLQGSYYSCSPRSHRAVGS